ncbi:MAG: AmmeMemoRadiSam system protein B [Planctomycetota bacterium]|nr:AmmeMemoRadiSam system protein B [Planctomycetota bacterium]
MMSRRRRPCAAGTFYPADPQKLRTTVLSLSPSQSDPEPARAVVVPHAGYQFSGALAADVLSQVIVPKTCILLGPNHTGMGAPYSVWNKGAWEMPFGDVPIDEDLAEQLLDTIPLLSSDTAAHRREHSIEVQLPLLMNRNPELSVVPVSLSSHDLDALVDIGEKLAEIVRERSVLVVASNDMTHFESAETAARMDSPSIDAMLNVQPETLYEYVTGHRVTMCGVVPVTVTLAMCRELGVDKGRKVGYTHSGKATGDLSSVVAYLGMIFPREKA